MSALLSSEVERCPFTIPVEWYALTAFVEIVEFLEVIIFDCAGAFFIEESERNLVLGIWFRQEIFKRSPVMQCNFPRTSTVSNAKQDGILFSFYLVLILNSESAMELFV